MGKRAIGHSVRSALAAGLAAALLGVFGFNACSLNPQPTPPAPKVEAGNASSSGATSTSGSTSGGAQGATAGVGDNEPPTDSGGLTGNETTGDGITDDQNGEALDPGSETSTAAPGSDIGAGGATTEAETGSQGAAGAAGARDLDVI